MSFQHPDNLLLNVKRKKKEKNEKKKKWRILIAEYFVQRNIIPKVEEFNIKWEDEGRKKIT